MHSVSTTLEALHMQVRGIEIDMLAGFGAYSIYPRGSVGEVMQTIQIVGAPY